MIEHGIGAEEEEPRLTRGGRAGRELAAAPGARLDDVGAGPVGDLARAVLGAGIDHDHLAHKPVEARRDQRGERIGEGRLGVEGRDDD